VIGYAFFEAWLVSQGFVEEWEEDVETVLDRFAAWEFGAQVAWKIKS